MAGRPVRMSGGRTHEGAKPEPSDRWIDEGRVGGSKPAAQKKHYSKKRGTGIEVPELAALVGAKRAATLQARLTEAADAFSDERFGDARRLLTPIASEAPTSPAVRELLGLTQYRLGKWKEAVSELEAFVGLTSGSTEQHPVLADCYRALRRWKRVDEIWTELRESSPSAELVNEGRIVAAGALADQDRLRDAISLLERGWKPPKVPHEHHLRRAYALGALYERAGDLPRARITFAWVQSIDPGFADVSERMTALT